MHVPVETRKTLPKLIYILQHVLGSTKYENVRNSSIIIIKARYQFLDLNAVPNDSEKDLACTRFDKYTIRRHTNNYSF